MDGRVDNVRPLHSIVFAAIALGIGIALEFAGWLQPYRPFEFCALVAAGLMAAAFWPAEHSAADHVTMAPSAVVELACLLTFGTGPAVLVAGLDAIATGRLANRDRIECVRRTLIDALVAVAAVEAGGFVYAGAGTVSQGVMAEALRVAPPILMFGLTRTAAVHLVTPIVARRAIARSWRSTLLREQAMYVIGGSVAVLLTQAIDHRLWGALAISAAPLSLAYAVYADYVRRLDAAHQHRDVVDSLDRGMAVVSDDGRVTLWNEPLERLLGCPRERALGQTVVAAAPALRDTPLPRAIADAIKDRKGRTLPCIGWSSSGGARTLQIQIRPLPGDGATLLWEDVTDRTREDQALKRKIERLALAVDGSHDGLWEWDLRTQELYVSSRWKAMLGLDGGAVIGRPEHWFDRVHPEDAAGLRQALKAHSAGDSNVLRHEHRIRHEDGTYRWFLCHAVAESSHRRVTRIAGSLTDTTAHVDAEERMRTAGFLDPLTGLRNRADFLDRVGRRLEEFKRQPTTGRFAVLYLDLDRFKVVNDSLGHLVGDELLVAVSRRLESCLRGDDCLGRLGGDEFAILLNTVADEPQANVVAFRIQDALSAPLSVAGRDVFTSASIGIAFAHGRYASPDEIMHDADTAMYQAKAKGKARHELFDADMHARTRDRLGLESDLRRAVNSNDFEVHYQPIVSLASGKCVGFESLIRWSRNGESVSPATFIPMAEELGVIDTIGTWVLQQACRTFADWQRRYPEAGLECITVNASSRQLTQRDFLLDVERAVHDAGLRPADLRIEVTETALLDSPNVVADLLGQLRDFGVKIYLDDFGTGCSSLSHLHKLPVDALKIDRSFVKSLLLPDRPAIVESILALARTLNTSVVAEGIETEVQARELQRLGCTHAQGFLFSRPLAKQAAEELVKTNQPIGPKRDGAVASDSMPFYRSAPIEWPDQDGQQVCARPAAQLHAPVARPTTPVPALPVS